MKKRAFMRTSEGMIVSALVSASETATAFKQGTRVNLRAPLDLSPYGTLPAGTKMLVSRHCEQTGAVTLKMSRSIARWGNRITLVPFDNEDALAALNGQ